MSRTTDMTVGKPIRHILIFAIPLLLTNMGQQLYTIADAAIVGRGVGVDALAAVGATDWSYWLILWSVIGLTQCFATYVSRFFGEKNYRMMNKSIAMAVLLSLVIGTLLTVIGAVAAKPLMRLLNTPEAIVDSAATYLLTMISGTLIVMAYNLTACILRAFGNGKAPLIAMAIAASLNIALDLVFVFVFHLGVFGAALASILAQLVSFLFCFTQICRIDCVHLDKQAWKIDGKLVKSMLVFSLPIVLENILIALGGVILQSSINMQGSAFIAGYTATNKVYGLLESAGVGLGLACSTFFAQNYGAGKYDRFKYGFRSVMKIIAVLALAVTGLTLLVRENLIHLFLDVTEEGGREAFEIAVRYLSIMAVCLIFLLMLHVSRHALQAMAISVWSMLSGVLEFCVRVSMAKIVIHWMGSDALFVSEPIAWITALTCVLVPYLYYQKHLLRENKPV